MPKKKSNTNQAGGGRPEAGGNRGRFQPGWKGGPGRPRKRRPGDLAAELEELRNSNPFEVYVENYDPPISPLNSAPLSDWVDHVTRRNEFELNGFWLQKRTLTPAELDAAILLLRERKQTDSGFTLGKALLELQQ